MEPSWEFPLRIGAQADLTRLESVLCDARFDQDTVCRILKISQMSDIGSVDLAEIDFGRVPEHFALFVRLFLFVERLPRLEVERVLDRGVLDSFLTVGLLRTGSVGGIEEYYTPVFFTRSPAFGSLRTVMTARTDPHLFRLPTSYFRQSSAGP